MHLASLNQFQKALSQSSLFYPLGFTKGQIEDFRTYYQTVLQWNNRLHLTTLTSPTDFATRHILESAFATLYLQTSIRQIVDIGSGCGIPGIPIAILRPDLVITLVEASKKKAIFLKEVAWLLELKNLKVSNRRFEAIQKLDSDVCITSRALDDLSQLLPRIIALGLFGRQQLLFGNDELIVRVQLHIPSGWRLASNSIPLSINRVLVNVSRETRLGD